MRCVGGGNAEKEESAPREREDERSLRRIESKREQGKGKEARRNGRREQERVSIFK